MQPASGSDEDGSHGEHSAKERPTKFVYDENDTFYFPPAICKLLHYRSAAILCGLVEVALLALTVLAFFSLQLEKGITEVWLTMAMVGMLAFAAVTTSLMIYGIITEQAKYLWPQMAFMHIEVILLIISAIVSITSMSMGIQTTHRLFGAFVSVHEMEDHFGPIWPFNMAVLSFFGAAIVVWFYIIVRGAYDYILDKQYFTKSPNIEMVKKVAL
uniref:MARVEL domain-containing protein n=1 Tax=Ascaris lumbricoides TaxID=6252 RepID=A0A0M3HXL1_ASCLU